MLQDLLLTSWNMQPCWNCCVHDCEGNFFFTTVIYTTVPVKKRLLLELDRNYFSMMCIEEENFPFKELITAKTFEKMSLWSHYKITPNYFTELCLRWVNAFCQIDQSTLVWPNSTVHVTNWSVSSSFHNTSTMSHISSLVREELCNLPK